MKIGLHLSMLCRNWTDDVSVYLKELREAGFDGVEISLYGTTADHLHRVISEAQILGFDIFLGTGVDEMHNPSSEDEQIRAQALTYLRECIDLASDAHAIALQGVLYAPWQGFSALPRDQRWRNAASILHTAGDYAKDKGIRLHMEVINRFETDFMNTLDEGADFLHLLDHVDVHLLADVFHMNIEENDIMEALRRNIKQIGCIHVSENHRGVPGSGHIDWKALLSCLKEIEYNGYLIMETFVEAHTEVGDGMCMRRNLCERPAVEEAIRGLRYLREIEREC